MKCFQDKMLCKIKIVAMATMILLGAAVITCADGPVLNTFSPGTIIKSSEVNDNFTALSNALPGLKWVGPPQSFSFTTSYQIVNQITVTAPSDGVFLIFANTQVALNLKANGGNMVNFCISTSPSETDGRAFNGVSFVAPCTDCGPAISVPVTMIGTEAVTKGADKTFYLLAKKHQNTEDTIDLQSASMFAVFLPKQL